MAPIKAESVEAELRGASVSVLIDPKALGLFQRDFPNLRPIGVTFVYDRVPTEPDVHGKPKQDAITIAFRGPESEKEGVLSLDCSRPDALPKVVKLLDNLIGEGGSK